jgi:hypothetical protein
MRQRLDELKRAELLIGEVGHRAHARHGTPAAPSRPTGCRPS